MPPIVHDNSNVVDGRGDLLKNEQNAAEWDSSNTRESPTPSKEGFTDDRDDEANEKAAIQDTLTSSSGDKVSYDDNGEEKKELDEQEREDEIEHLRAERICMVEQIEALKQSLKERDEELTSLRLESFERDSLYSRDTGYTSDKATVRVTTDEWRALNAARDTALVQAGELATRLAESRAFADEQSELLQQTNAILKDTQEQLMASQEKCRSYEAKSPSNFATPRRALWWGKKDAASPSAVSPSLFQTLSRCSSDGSEGSFLQQQSFVAPTTPSTVDATFVDDHPQQEKNAPPDAATRATIQFMAKKIERLEKEKASLAEALTMIDDNDEDDLI